MYCTKCALAGNCNERTYQNILKHYMKIIHEQDDSKTEDSSESFIILSNTLRGFLNKLNPFRSQIIFTEQSILMKNLMVLNSDKQSPIGTDPSTAFCVNNFMILNDESRKLDVDSSKDKSELFGSRKINMTNQTGSSSHYFGNHSKYSDSIYKRSILQGEGMSPRMLQNLTKSRQLHNQNTLSENLITNVDKYLKKTRTPILQFIDNKNFVIAGANYLRVYHLSENVW